MGGLHGHRHERGPKFFRKYVKGAENALDDKKELWGSVDAQQTMA